MNRLDENYLEFVREALYNPQFKHSLQKNTKTSRNKNKLKNNVGKNEDSPKNVVKKRFKTKKETFKAKAKLKKRLEPQIKTKQVRFIDDSVRNGTEDHNSHHAPSDVKTRIATPFKSFKPKTVHISKSPEHNTDISATIVKNISPSLKENNLLRVRNNVADSLENASDADKGKSGRVKNKKRRLSQSDSPEIHVKRKKEKSFTKKGKQLVFDDSSDEDKSNKEIQSKFIVSREKEEIGNKTVEWELNDICVNFVQSIESEKNAKKVKKPKQKLKDKIVKSDKSMSFGTNEEVYNSNEILDVENEPFIVEKVNLKTGEFPSKKSDFSSKIPHKKLKRIKSRKVSKSINLTSSDKSSKKLDNGLKSKKPLDTSSHLPEDPLILFDIYDDETIGVKGLKFRKFCSLFPPTYNEQFLGNNNALNIPKKYFNITQNDFELESRTEISNYKTRNKYHLNDEDLRNTSECFTSECHTSQLIEDSAQKINQNGKVDCTDLGKDLNQKECVSDLQVLTHDTEKAQDSHKEKLYCPVGLEEELHKKENILNLQVLNDDTEKSQDHPLEKPSVDPSSSSEEIENSFNSSQVYADENQHSDSENQNTLEPTIITMRNGNKIVVLGLNVKCHIHGLCLIKVLHGEIEILGANLSRESGEKKFYSPRGSALLYVRNKSILYVSNLIKLKDLISQELLQNDNDGNLTFEHHSAIFVCSKHNDHYIDFIEKYIPQKIFPEISGQGPRIDFKLSGTWNRMKSSEKWEEVLENVTSESKTVISGGKGVGKSTFLRFAVNFLLRKFNKIRVIDLDPGQSEFYPPGCLTVTTIDTEVFGPNYTHLMKPDSLILSHINMGYDIEKYLRSVQCILESTLHMESLPTLINLHGFTQGLGFDISVQSLKYIQPNLVIQINSRSYNKNYKTDITDKEVNKFLNKNNNLLQEKTVNETTLSYDFVKLKSLSENNEAWSLEARQGREINILSYFGQMMSDSVNDLISGELNIYSINISALSITNSEGKDIPPSTINASLVALGSKLKGHSSIFSCYGYGFVRGMDLDDDMLVLITPESNQTLENVSHLVLGSVTTPPSLLMTAAEVKGHVPYVSVGELMDFSQFTKRSYLPPRK